MFSRLHTGLILLCSNACWASFCRNYSYVSAHDLSRDDSLFGVVTGLYVLFGRSTLLCDEINPPRIKSPFSTRIVVRALDFFATVKPYISACVFICELWVPCSCNPLLSSSVLICSYLCIPVPCLAPPHSVLCFPHPFDPLVFSPSCSPICR